MSSLAIFCNLPVSTGFDGHAARSAPLASIVSLDVEIAELQEKLGRLLVERASLEADHADWFSLHAPVRRLPSEILEAMFRALRDDCRRTLRAMDRLAQTPLTTVLSLCLPSPSFLYLFYFVSSSVGSTSSHGSASSHSQSASNYSYNTSTFSTSTSSGGGMKKKWWPSLAGMGRTKGWTSDAGACCRCRFYFFGLNARAACFMSFASTPLLSAAAARLRLARLGF
ncbi:hypothetical protein B0H11DRAFT_2227313 [Mycena galericulata]|nr:hypothetical protein B0H11DRAFT_2227313 [Mycena galericulata]